MKKYSVLLLAAMGGDALIFWITKTLIHSLRPSNGIFYEAGYSFPSGHTTISIAFCGLLTYFVWHEWNSPKAKTASSKISVSTISIVALDKIYLNVHWFSDVVGGLLLGIFWLTLTLWIFRNAEKTEKIHKFKFLSDAGTLKTRHGFFLQEAKSQLNKKRTRQNRKNILASANDRKNSRIKRLTTSTY